MAKLAGSRRAARRRTTCWTRGSMAEQFGVAASAQSAQRRIRRIRRVDVETCRIEGPAAPLPHRGMLVVAGIRDRIQEVGVTTRRIDLDQAPGITAPGARKGQLGVRQTAPRQHYAGHYYAGHYAARLKRRHAGAGAARPGSPPMSSTCSSQACSVRLGSSPCDHKAKRPLDRRLWHSQ